MVPISSSMSAWLVAVVVGKIEALDLGVERCRLLVVVDRQLVAQIGERRAAGEIVRRRLRDGAPDEILLQRLPRLAVDVGGLHQDGARGVEGAERQLLLGLLPELGDLRIGRRQRAHLGAHLDEGVGRFLQLAAALGRRQRGGVAADQGAVERGERHVGAGGHQLDLDAHVGRDVGHGEQQPLALRQLLLAGRCEEQARQAALDIGQLLAARLVVDLLLHQRQRRAHLDALGAEIFDQRFGERRMPVGAVGGGFAGRCGEGEQDAFGAADAAKPGLDVLVRRDRDDAAPVIGLRGRCRLRAPNGSLRQASRMMRPIFATSLTACADLFQRQGRCLQRVQRGRVGIDRQQPVVAGDLDAVPGEIDQRHVGARAVLAKIVERAAHALEVAIGLQRHLEAELFERVAERLARRRPHCRACGSSCSRPRRSPARRAARPAPRRQRARRPWRREHAATFSPSPPIRCRGARHLRTLASRHPDSQGDSDRLRQAGSRDCRLRAG